MSSLLLLFLLLVLRQVLCSVRVLPEDPLHLSSQAAAEDILCSLHFGFMGLADMSMVMSNQVRPFALITVCVKLIVEC